MALHPNASDEVKDLRLNNRAIVLATEWLSAKQMEKQSAAEADAIKAEFMDLIGDAGTAMLEGFTVKAPTVKATPDKEITADDVGPTIKGRKSYRPFRSEEHTPEL